MNNLSKAILAGIFWLNANLVFAQPASQPRLTLTNAQLRIEWQKNADGYRVTRVRALQGGKWIDLSMPSGEYTFLYSATQPDSVPKASDADERARSFPEPIYKYQINTWKNNLAPVPLNTAGTPRHFFPIQGRQEGKERVTFTSEQAEATLQSSWKADPKYPNDVLVTMQLTAKKAGYFSLATPSLANIPEQELVWGMIPGYFQGKKLQPDLVMSYAYGQGIPKQPIVVRERTVSTLAPLLSNRQGLTLAVIPEPGTGRNPWESNRDTHSNWQLGLSLMSRRGALTPTAYHPVLGEKGSFLKEGESCTFAFRYSLQAADWYTVYKHAIYDVYRLADFRALKQTQQSLTDRILALHRYVLSDTTSLWRTESFQGKEIGAQAYLGGVVGADDDAMKNSDYGSMWMLAGLTQDTVLQQTRLPFVRNFKLAQQQHEPGFFQGAAVGQYYLSKSRKFTEEWGPYVEPIGLTYYTMLDMGNILLFEPNDAELKERLRLGAERLLSWQHADGHWEVAYDRETEKPLFTDLKDLRPTFYGLLVAYRVLGDKKYLAAARKGADWFIRQASKQAHFLGVCGDARFIPDFATGQSIQALLDLYKLTNHAAYREAAIETARIYTTSVYTHPIPSRAKKTVNGTIRQDWEISQAGLSFEHGGSIGSATQVGPILLASHAGMFIRLFSLTKDSLFLDMARAGALGRDAFVHPTTRVASYYWGYMNAGAGPFPHHAWWQIGWIADYLLSEIQVRSGEKITFPRGFVTPKVGPHQTYGFAPGTVYGQAANLQLIPQTVQLTDPQVDYFQAVATQSKRAFVLMLNNDDESRLVGVKVNAAKLMPGQSVRLRSAYLLDATGKRRQSLAATGGWEVNLPAYGLGVIELTYE